MCEWTTISFAILTNLREWVLISWLHSAIASLSCDGFLTAVYVSGLLTGSPIYPVHPYRRWQCKCQFKKQSPFAIFKKYVNLTIELLPREPPRVTRRFSPSSTCRVSMYTQRWTMRYSQLHTCCFVAAACSAVWSWSWLIQRSRVDSSYRFLTWHSE